MKIDLMERATIGDASIAGTEYTLYAKTDIFNKAKTVKYFSKDEAIANYKFDEHGVATAKIINTKTIAKIKADGNKVLGLPMGVYFAKETKVSEGYTLDETIYDYTLSYVDEETTNIPVAGTVINIVDKAPLEVIKISTNSNSTAKVIGDAEFTAILTKYVDFYGSFEEARKHLDEFAEDEYSVFRTGPDGHGISSRIAYGEYTVNETYTPSPEINTVEEFYVTIDENSDTPIRELVENDSPLEAYIKLQKKDKNTGKYVTYSNATFILYRLNEETSMWERVQCKVGNQYFDEWTTNNEGVAVTETKLNAGQYKLEELRIPEGFIQLDEELLFNVDNRNKTLNYDKDYDAWITVTAENTQPKGKLQLRKKVNLRDVDKTLIKDIDYTQISFQLIAEENIIDYADGSTIYEKGKIIGTYNLNEEGTLTVADLPMGKYSLQELTTVPGAVLDTTKKEVNFEKKDTVTKEYVVGIDFENETTIVEISKQDITGEKELEGATLQVIDENNEIIDEWVSSERPHTIEGLQVGKTYSLVEKIAVSGYVKATRIEFTVENTAEKQKVKMIDKIMQILKTDVEGNAIEGAKLKVINKDGKIVDSWTSEINPHQVSGLTEGEEYILQEEYSTGSFVIAKDIKFVVSYEKETQEIVMVDKLVEMSKVDIAGNEIEGATMQVYDEEGNLVDEWVSGKEAHKIKGLEEGKKYKLHEEISAPDYVTATDIEFEVTTDKETQKVIMVDKLVEMSKVDIAGDEIEGATMQVYDEEGNLVDEWVSGKEAHKIKGLEEGKKYKLHEEVSAPDYVKATDIEFEVTTDKETQEIIMIDKLVEIVKTDLVTGEELPGAELIVKDKEGNIIDQWTSTEEPHRVTGLEEGKEYELIEITCPYGYEVAESITFEVTTEKENQLIEMKDMPILKSVQILKLDSQTEETIKDDFEFGLYEDETATNLIKQLKSDKETATVLFDNLRYGTLYIKELKAPKGYQLSDKIVKVEINDTGVYADGELLDEKDAIYTINFYNDKIPEIPTGSEIDITFLICCIAISLIGITTCIAVLKMKGKRK